MDQFFHPPGNGWSPLSFHTFRRLPVVSMLGRNIALSLANATKLVIPVHRDFTFRFNVFWLIQMTTVGINVLFTLRPLWWRDERFQKFGRDREGHPGWSWKSLFSQKENGLLQDLLRWNLSCLKRGRNVRKFITIVVIDGFKTWWTAKCEVCLLSCNIELLLSIWIRDTCFSKRPSHHHGFMAEALPGSQVYWNASTPPVSEGISICSLCENKWAQWAPRIFLARLAPKKPKTDNDSFSSGSANTENKVCKKVLTRHSLTELPFSSQRHSW